MAKKILRRQLTCAQADYGSRDIFPSLGDCKCLYPEDRENILKLLKQKFGFYRKNNLDSPWTSDWEINVMNFLKKAIKDSARSMNRVQLKVLVESDSDAKTVPKADD